jgi:hypothetical protein
VQKAISDPTPLISGSMTMKSSETRKKGHFIVAG